MIIGRVIGHVWATKKEESLTRVCFVKVDVHGQSRRIADAADHILQCDRPLPRQRHRDALAIFHAGPCRLRCGEMDMGLGHDHAAPGVQHSHGPEDIGPVQRDGAIRSAAEGGGGASGL